MAQPPCDVFNFISFSWVHLFHLRRTFFFLLRYTDKSLAILCIVQRAHDLYLNLVDNSLENSCIHKSSNKKWLKNVRRNADQRSFAAESWSIWSTPKFQYKIIENSKSSNSNTIKPAESGHCIDQQFNMFWFTKTYWFSVPTLIFFSRKFILFRIENFQCFFLSVSFVLNSSLSSIPRSESKIMWSIFAEIVIGYIVRCVTVFFSRKEINDKWVIVCSIHQSPDRPNRTPFFLWCVIVVRHSGRIFFATSFLSITQCVFMRHVDVDATIFNLTHRPCLVYNWLPSLTRVDRSSLKRRKWYMRSFLYVSSPTWNTKKTNVSHRR